MVDLEQCWKCESLHVSVKVHFSIPEVSLDVEEEENEIRYYIDIDPEWRQPHSLVQATKLPGLPPSTRLCGCLLPLMPYVAC